MFFVWNLTQQLQVEHSIIGSVANDRSICIYDLRMNNPVRKVVLQMRSNALCWNPMIAFNFTVVRPRLTIVPSGTRSPRFRSLLITRRRRTKIRICIHLTCVNWTAHSVSTPTTLVQCTRERRYV